MPSTRSVTPSPSKSANCGIIPVAVFGAVENDLRKIDHGGPTRCLFDATAARPPCLRYRCGSSDYPPMQDRKGVGSTFAFGSAHTAGFNMAMCDGAVHFINYGIDMTVYLPMGSRN